MFTKKRIYVSILALTVFISFIISIICWFFSQTHLQQLAQINPDSVVPAGSTPFLFAIIIFMIVCVSSCCYITTWRKRPCGEYAKEYSKSELIILTAITIIAIVVQFSTLNVTWEYAFIGLALILYEIITWITSYYKCVKMM